MLFMVGDERDLMRASSHALSAVTVALARRTPWWRTKNGRELVAEPAAGALSLVSQAVCSGGLSRRLAGPRDGRGCPAVAFECVAEGGVAVGAQELGLEHS